MRVYLPATWAQLASWAAAGELPAGPAFAVTPALRESYASGDTDELEWVALSWAARASLRLISAQDGAQARRVVLAADAADPSVRPAVAGYDPQGRAGELTSSPASVELTAPVPWARLAAVLVDDESAQPVVSAAVRACRGADSGDADAASLVEDAEGEPLAWYAAQEVPALLAASGTDRVEAPWTG